MATFSKWWTLALTLCLILQAYHVNSSVEVMKNFSVKFASALDKCKKELNIPDAVMQDFNNYWREDYELVNSEMGCALMCMAAKFDLLTHDEQKLHHGNLHEFVKSHGADDNIAKQVVTMLHECEMQTDNITDDCTRILELAKCFRTRVHGLKWAPSAEVVLEEMMIEI